MRRAHDTIAISNVDVPGVSMQVVVLSPHRDDAAFSCGFLLQQLVRAGAETTIVNVCTISSYAPYLLPDARERVTQVTAARADEDLAFIAMLTDGGRSRVRLVDLAWMDVPLRWQAADSVALEPLPLRCDEIAALRQALLAFHGADMVLAPAAIGGHLDHRLVREAALQTFPAASLVFYEDLPYACRAAAVGRVAELHPASAWLPEAGCDTGRKRDLSMCYPSQIAADVADEMAVYAEEHGGRECFAGPHEALRTLRDMLQPAGVGIASAAEAARQTQGNGMAEAMPLRERLVSRLIGDEAGA